MKKFPASDEEEQSGSSTTLSLQSNPYLIKSYNYSIGRTVEKGWGIFAEEDIPIDTAIILERPTLIIEEHPEKTKKERLGSEKRRSPEIIEADRLREEFEKLSKEQQSDIMSLHNAQEEYEASALYGIFLTNFFQVSLRNKLSGIYVFCSRLNHSCDPNCTFDFSRAPSSEDIKAHTITITTRRSIKAGDQLTISYVPLKMRLGARQDNLLMNHGFTCDCARCTAEGDKLYDWPVEGQNVKLRFRPARLLQTEAGEGQGWDFITIIESISTKDGAVQENEVIMQEAPLILLEKNEMERDSSLLYNEFSKLSKLQRNRYLRLYNWRVGSESPTWAPGPSYQVETTDDDDEPTEWLAWTRKCKPLPSNATLSGIWEANIFTLDPGMEGVFAFTSHLNHSCSPTCRVAWNAEQSTLDLVATMPLNVGEEITICYNYSEIFNLPFKHRQQFLEDNYGFKCRCFRCRADYIEAPPESGTRTADGLKQGSAAGALVELSQTSNWLKQTPQAKKGLVENRKPV